MFDLMDICGTIVIGEGVKDEAPGLFIREKVGRLREGSPRFDIALDPADGTTNSANGMPNSLNCIVAALVYDSNGSSLQDTPAFYFKKLAYPFCFAQGLDGRSLAPH
jgi:fructose-1,6-bisphosphatase II